MTTARHILAVNDDPAILRLFDELLAEEGYAVTLDTFQRTTEEVLTRIRDLGPDLVILDYIIGNEGGGWQLLQAMQMDRSTRGIPVIVCTAAVRQINEIGAHLTTMGISVVLKPFDIDHLLEEIARVWAQGERSSAE